MAYCFDVGVWGPGVFGVAQSVQETSFGGILGDFGGACLNLGIHVSAGWQWELGSMPLGYGLAYWWLGDILCFGILCVRPRWGRFS